MKVAPLSVLIVGCGNIGGKFDEDRPPDDLPLTHAGAFSKDPRYRIAACVDPDHLRRLDFAKRWNIPNEFTSISELLAVSGSFDVISICSPTGSHGADLDVALQLKPKLIFCEKPVANSAVETANLSNKCNINEIFCAVNYSRRWDLDVHRLKEDIRLGQRGQLRSVTGVYSKGLLNNGSHMLDLLLSLLGPLCIRCVGKPINDWFPEDPSIPVWLEAGNNVPINLSCGDANDYSIFELQFVFESGVLVMEDGGISWRERKIIESPVYKGYRILDAGVRREGAYKNSMTQATDNIWNTVVNGMDLLSDARSALETHVMCEKIATMADEF